MKRKALYKNSTQQKQHHFVVGENGGAFIFQFSSFIIDSFKGTQHCSSKIFTILLCALVCLPTIQPNTIPPEAAFQGKCPPDGNPCTQICFNIHNNMYECGCKNDFVLSTDGYNCILQVPNTTYSEQNENVNKSKQSEEVKGSTPNQASLSSPASSENQHQNNNEDRTAASFQNPLHNTIPSKAPLSIHIEVDIDPPPDNGKDSKKLTENEMQKLGLPSHHVHWSLPPVLSLSRRDEDTLKEHQNTIVEGNTLNDKINEVARVRNQAAYLHETKQYSSTKNDIQDRKDTKKANKENLLAPSDIHITYSVSDDLGGSGEYENDLSLNVNNFDDDGSHDSDTDSWTFGREDSNQNEKQQDQPRYTSSLGYNKNNTEEIEPPRALPSRIVNDIQSGQYHRNGDLSDRFPHSKAINEALKENLLNRNSIELLTNSNEYQDHIVQHDSEEEDSSLCDLDCGMTGGTCFMEKEHHNKNDRNFNENDWVKIKKRCLCPLGKQGPKCENDQSITSPHFSGHTSHLSLPTLTNAYSDLQLSLEFRPESLDGIILLTGETQEMTGDYLAIVLREGHVELRLDCGTGPGAVRTSGKVRLNHWNRLTVFRHDWGVWLQLNGGRHDEGRSQGLFSRITFALPVVLGSPEGHFSNTAHFLETSGSFQGGIRNLEINNKLYNFALQNNGGDAIEGVDISECPGNSEEESCKSVKCHHHGLCAMKNVSLKDDIAEGDARMEEGEDVMIEPYCRCPLGFHGQFCEQAVDVQVPSFSGTSYLIYAGFPNTDASPLWNEFEFVILPKSPNGLIFYNGNDMEADSSKATDVNSEDFLAVFMSKGYLEFAFNAGDGITLIRSHHPLKLNEWHTVKISRTGLLAEIRVDKQRRVSHIGAGAFTQVSTSEYNVYIGGVPTLEIVSPYIPVKNSFEGCIQKVSINNVNLRMMQSALGGINVGPCTDHPCSTEYVFSTSDDSDNLEFPEMSLNNYGVPPCGDHGACKPHLDNFTCECPLYSAGDRCQFQLPLLDVDRKSAIPGFTGDSFLHFENDEIAKNLIGNSNSINMRVKIAAKSKGLLLWTGGDNMSPASDYLMLGVAEHGKLHFRFNLGNGEAVLVYNDTAIDDGRWHRIKATRTEQTATLKVDGGHIITGASPGKLRQLNGNGHLFIGGTEDLEYLPIQMFRKGIVGCVGELSVGRVYSIDMIQKAKNGKNVDACRDHGVFN